jgi:2-polyprenyl-6-methoxyphenol hydroxylase-like FAD-dependent oxidoreductase
MRILISGGGLAGLTTAYWCQRHGHEPFVVEKAPILRNDGYGLDFFGAGYDVAERMGIIDALAARQLFVGSESGIAYVDANGKILAELKYDAIREVLGGRYLPLMHGTLVEVLNGAMPDDVEIRYGTRSAQ